MRVAAFDFSESEVLASLFEIVLVERGVPVVNLGPLGPREVVQPALESGHVDVVPEYLGTLLGFASLGELAGTADPVVTMGMLERELEDRDLVGLDPAPAQDRNELAMARRRADELGVTRISDLARVEPGLRFGGPPECPSRPLCLVGLRRLYQLEFSEFVPLATLRLRARALVTGEVDVALMFSTAAELLDERLVVLDDDFRLQPAENVVPVVRAGAMEDWGDDLARPLRDLTVELHTADLAGLNRDVAGGMAVADAARDWLVRTGLIDS